MLVLSREKNQKIYLGNNIVIEVVEIRAGKCRLGIVAPKDIPVLREEVLLSLTETERAAVPNLVADRK